MNENTKSINHKFKEVEKILKSNSGYLETRIDEVFCEKHGLIRYWEGGFQGCFLCPADKDIQDQLVKANVGSILSKEKEK